MKNYCFVPRRFSNTLALSAAVLLMLSALLVRAGAQRREAAAYLRPEHREVVDKWLSGRPNQRLASEADCVDEEGLAFMRQSDENYYPYYAVADLNGDGKEDFAVALINRRFRKDNFAIAIFNGPLRVNSAPAFIGSGFDLSTGGLFVRPSGNRSRLLAGVFASDDCWILEWRGKRYIQKNCFDEMGK